MRPNPFARPSVCLAFTVIFVIASSTACGESAPTTPTTPVTPVVLQVPEAPIGQAYRLDADGR